MKRYRVEFRHKDGNFRADCYENKLEYWKTICKLDQKQLGGGKCYYREFPLTNAKKIYF